MGRGCARRPSGQQTALPAGQYVPHFIWKDTESDGDCGPINIPFTGVEGLREEMPLDAEPIEYFSKYFTDEVTDVICKETNRYAKQYIEAKAANVRPKSIVHDWKPTNRNEIKALLGLCILIGIVYKPIGSMFGSTDSFYHTLIFGQVMSRKRFQLLQRFLHFPNNQDPQYNLNYPDRDGLFKIRTLMGMVRQKFNSVYYPPENLTVDESLVLYKGRLVFKQFFFFFYAIALGCCWGTSDF